MWFRSLWILTERHDADGWDDVLVGELEGVWRVGPAREDHLCG